MVRAVSSKRFRTILILAGAFALVLSLTLIITSCSSDKKEAEKPAEGQATLPQDVGSQSLLDTTAAKVPPPVTTTPPKEQVAQKPAAKEQAKPKPTETTKLAEKPKATEPEIVKTLILPANTDLEVSLLDTLATGQNKVGDRFRATVKGPVVQGETLNLPDGTILEGEIAALNDGKAEGEKASIKLKFTDLMMPGEKSIPIEGYVITNDNSGVIYPGAQAATIAKDAAIGAAAGGIVGAIAGGKAKDALKGAVAGAAAGGALGAVLHKDQVTLEKGKNLNISIVTPVYQEKIKKEI